MVTSDLGRVTTVYQQIPLPLLNCGDVRSRTSYNVANSSGKGRIKIVVTSDLGRVTTVNLSLVEFDEEIVVTSDLGRVTTKVNNIKDCLLNCGDVRSRTSYNSSG